MVPILTVRKGQKYGNTQPAAPLRNLCQYAQPGRCLTLTSWVPRAVSLSAYSMSTGMGSLPSASTCEALRNGGQLCLQGASYSASPCDPLSVGMILCHSGHSCAVSYSMCVTALPSSALKSVWSSAEAMAMEGPCSAAHQVAQSMSAL